MSAADHVEGYCEVVQLCVVFGHVCQWSECGSHFAGKPSCILTYVGLLLLFVVFPCVHETCVQCAFLLKVRSNYVEAYVCVYSI